jgi:N-acetyl-alpha-D-muramate 1-phosphate uridylyltransferase
VRRTPTASGLPTVCILAGGRGTRLGVRVEKVPKPLLEVAGKPFLWHQLRLLAAAGASDVVLCVGYHGEAIRQRIGSELFGLRIAYSFDGPELDGTLGAIRRARGMLGERFLVLYGDTYLRIDYAAAAAAWLASGLPAVMCVLRNEGRWESSNALYADGRVLAYDKREPSADMRWIDYGLGGLEQAALDRVPAETTDLCELYTELAREGLLCGFEASERFYEIGTPVTLAETDAFLRSQHERTKLRRFARALRTRSDLLGQGTRYALAGGFVTLVYLLTTTALATLGHVHFQLALAIGFCCAVAVHFTLQRKFVWAGRGDFALPLHRQTARYLATAGTQYGLTAAGTSLLPSALGLPVEPIYLTLAAILVSTNFVVFRNVVFYPETGRAERVIPPAERARRNGRRSDEASPDPAHGEGAPETPSRATDPTAR